MGNMKTTVFLIHRLCLLLLLVSAGFTACSDGKEDNGESAKAEVTEFSPLSGGRSTLLTLRGKNFGNDPAAVRVTLNGKDLAVKSVSGEAITAEVQKGSSSGILRVILGERPHAQVLIYDAEFTYISNFVVSTWLGGDTAGENDGPFQTATLLKPRFLNRDRDGAMYIVEDGAGNASDFQCIRMAKNGSLKTIVNAASTPLLSRIRAVGFSPDGNTMYIANDNNAAGSAGFAIMRKNGTDFSGLEGLWTQAGVTFTGVHPLTGKVLVGVHTNAWVYEYDGADFIARAQLPTAAGTPADKGNINGMAFDKDGTTVYIVSRAQHVIYKGEYDMATGEFKNLKILAGKYGTTGYADGMGTNAMFNTPCQADIDEEGNLYVADRVNHCIRMVTPEGEVSTYAGKNSAGMADGIASQAEFNNPEGCRFGADGALYVADYSNNRIRKVEEKAATGD